MCVLLNDRNLRRAATLVLFIGLLYAFRHLILLFVLFVLFSRSLAFCAGHLSRRTRLPFRVSLFGLVVLGLGVVAIVGFLAARGVITNMADLRNEVEQLVRLIEDSPLYREYGSA